MAPFSKLSQFISKVVLFLRLDIVDEVFFLSINAGILPRAASCAFARDDEELRSGVEGVVFASSSVGAEGGVFASVGGAKRSNHLRARLSNEP